MKIILNTLFVVAMLTASMSFVLFKYPSAGAEHLQSSHFMSPVKAFPKSTIGLYNLNGNAAEIVLEKGIALGGSWKSSGYDVRNKSVINYSGPGPCVGFRPVVVVIKK